jgi:hypothetical protein
MEDVRELLNVLFAVSNSFFELMLRYRIFQCGDSVARWPEGGVERAAANGWFSTGGTSETNKHTWRFWGASRFRESLISTRTDNEHKEPIHGPPPLLVLDFGPPGGQPIFGGQPVLLDRGP